MLLKLDMIFILLVKTTKSYSSTSYHQ